MLLGPSPRRTAAAALALCILLAGCSSKSQDSRKESDDAKATTGSIKIQPLFVAGDSGGVGTETISRKKATGHDFRVEFSEDEVSGVGDASRAAAWNAAIVSTLLTGAPLEGTFGFQFEGKIDGPSAGALTTVGLLALERGDKISKSVTMTGTINATGSVGPVGGIPEKIKGAGEKGLKKVLIPLGQRNTPNEKGKTVDVVRLGKDVGVDVVEVGDVYEAYPLLTGKKLDQPDSDDDPRLDNDAYDKVKAQIGASLARYDEAKRKFETLSPDSQANLGSSAIYQAATQAHDQALDLQEQGLVAGAFDKAQQAAMYMETTAAGGDLLTPLYTSGIDGLDTVIDQALDTSSAESRFTSFVDQLATFKPKTVPDVEAITVAYARAFDAYTLLEYATGQIQSLKDQYTQGDIDVTNLLNTMVTSLLYAQLSKSMITTAESIFELARDNPGPALDKDVDLREAGDFFRRGADANYAAFTTSGLVSEIAEQQGVSTDVVLNYLSAYDLNVAAARTQQAVLPSFEKYLGEKSPNAAYAMMGYGVSNYVRNQILVEKYYNNAKLDENYQVVGVQFQGALNNSLDLGRDQLGAEIAALRKAKTSPLLTVGSYESGALLANSGSVSDDFDALSEYSYGFVNARLLAYVGGRSSVGAVGD